MKVSVVVCTADSSPFLSKTLDSLLGNTVKPYEIIVVHQGPDSIAKKIISNINKLHGLIDCIQDTEYGLSRARNIGWKKATGDIIAYTDDDAFVKEDWIKNIVKTFSKDKKIGIVGGKIIPLYNQRNKNWTIPSPFSYSLPSYDQGDKTGEYPSDVAPPGVNFSIRRSILVTLVGFNEKLGVNKKRRIQIYGEDTDMALRAQNAGYTVLYCPECVVFHPIPLERQNLTYIKKRMFIAGITETCLYFLHHEPSYRHKLHMLKYRIIELGELMKAKKNMNSDLYEGKKSRMMGYLYSIIVYGLLFPGKIRLSFRPNIFFLPIFYLIETACPFLSDCCL